MIPLPYKLAIVGVALIGTFFLGREHGLQKYYDFKADVEAQRVLAAAKAEIVTKNVSNAWAAALDHANRNPRIVRVRDNCEVSVPATPGGIDGRSPYQGLGARADATITVAQCEARLNDAIIDAAQLMALQSWVAQQHEASK